MGKPEFSEDRDLLLLLNTVGIRFLGLTYDTVIGELGMALRIVGPQDEMVYFEVTGSAEATVAALRLELEASMYNHILGRPQMDTQWGQHG